MNFNYPDFLGHPSQDKNQNAQGNNLENPNTNLNQQSQQSLQNQQSQINQSLSNQQNLNTFSNIHPASDFNTILFNKLSSLNDNTASPPEAVSSRSPTSGPQHDIFLSPSTVNKDSFALPIELQGGIGTISSRRPSYAAESFTRSNFQPLVGSSIGSTNTSANYKSPQLGPTASGSTSYYGNNRSSGNNGNSTDNSNKQLSSFAMLNNYNQSFNFDQFNDAFADNFNLNSNFNDFQARRPSQLVEFQQQQQYPVNPYLHPQSSPLQTIQQNQIPSSFSLGSNQQFLSQQSSNHFQQQQQQSQVLSQSQQTQQPQHSPQHIPHPQSQQSQQSQPQRTQQSQNSAQFKQSINLENGLILKDQYIIASPDLKSQYLKTTKYFQDPRVTNEVLTKLNDLLSLPVVVKLITFIKNLNNLTFNHKILCLVINKNGKFDLLSYPNNSNIFLQRDDLVIVDGDRGKDLVMIVEPLVNLNFAILFNFLKKLEHLKSLTINDSNSNHNNQGQKINGTHSTSLNASAIINSHSNEDNEFIITLPTKQVLRFATPKEIHKISGKFLEEKKAFITCFNKIKELNLQSNLTLINVEYQSDFKKLIFYYFANFKRIDFRGLIKELFKIYKTRIWLCAVLPYDKPELYVTMSKEEAELKKAENLKESKGENDDNLIPSEYELSNDQILNFSINEFENLSSPNYFHSLNLLNLIEHLSNELPGYFYGFNNSSVSTGGNNNDNNGSRNAKGKGSSPTYSTKAPNSATGEHSKILPSFNPFGDNVSIKPNYQ